MQRDRKIGAIRLRLLRPTVARGGAYPARASQHHAGTHRPQPRDL